MIIMANIDGSISISIMIMIIINIRFPLLVFIGLFLLVTHGYIEIYAPAVCSKNALVPCFNPGNRYPFNR